MSSGWGYCNQCGYPLINCQCQRRENWLLRITTRLLCWMMAGLVAIPLTLILIWWCCR